MRKSWVCGVFAVLLLFAPTAGHCAGNEVFAIRGQLAGATVAFAGSDSSQVLSTAHDAAGTSDPEWRRVREVWVMALDYGIVVSFGVDAVGAGATQLGYTIEAGDMMVISGIDNVKSARFINKTAGSNSRVICTAFY